MADEAEDANAATDRLEAALERIAQLAAESRALQTPVALPESHLSVPQIAERLDSLIWRLRAALEQQE